MPYANDPAIIGWELANEAWNPGDASGNVLQVCFVKGLGFRVRDLRKAGAAEAWNPGDASGNILQVCIIKGLGCRVRGLRKPKGWGC